MITSYRLCSIILDARKILIVLTDGQSSGSVNQPSQELKNIGVIIFSVGVGSGINEEELETMASPPADEHVYLLDNFNELSTLAEKMSTKTCNGNVLYYILHSTFVIECQLIQILHGHQV